MINGEKHISCGLKYKTLLAEIIKKTNKQTNKQSKYQQPRDLPVRGTVIDLFPLLCCEAADRWSRTSALV